MILLPTTKKPLSPKRLKWLTIRVIKVWGFEAAFRRYLNDAPMFLCCHEMEDFFSALRPRQRTQFLEITDKLLTLPPEQQITLRQIIPILFPVKQPPKRGKAKTKKPRSETENV